MGAKTRNHEDALSHVSITITDPLRTTDNFIGIHMSQRKTYSYDIVEMRILVVRNMGEFWERVAIRSTYMNLGIFNDVLSGTWKEIRSGSPTSMQPYIAKWPTRRAFPTRRREN